MSGSVTDSYIQPPPNQGGPNVETSQLTSSPPAQTVVQRQRVTSGDPDDPSAYGLVQVRGKQMRVTDQTQIELLAMILDRLDLMYELMLEKF